MSPTNVAPLRKGVQEGLRPLRILITVPWGERLGGAETMLQTLLEGSRKYPHEIELIFFADGPWPCELVGAGFTVTVIDAGRIRQTHRMMSTIFRLALLLRRRNPDVVLNWMAKTQLYCSPAALLAGMSDRVVWWQHGIPASGWLDRLATTCPCAAVGCSSVAGAAAQAALRPGRKTFVVYPGITGCSPMTHRRRLLELPDDVLVVGIVGRLQPWKGQDRLLRAHALLRDRGYVLHTLIVGGDAYGLSPDYARSLRDLVTQLDLSGEVTFTDHVDDARPYINQMDVLVNASDAEPFGIVLLEAMVSNVPVVAVNHGGPAEIIDTGRTGMLARSGDPYDLAEVMEPLLRCPDLRHRIGCAGYESWSATFTQDAMCERIFAILPRLMLKRTIDDLLPTDGAP